MANTEGMPDDVIESLLGPNAMPDTGGNNRSSNSYTTASNNSNSSTSAGPVRTTRRRRAVEERMEMSMGERPAARVIRASPNNYARQQRQQQQQQEESQQYDEPPPAPPIIGAVVERSSGRSQPQGASFTSGNFIDTEDQQQQPKKRQSKFALQRQQQQGQQQQRMMQKNTETGAKQTGFPSVHVPLGTFVKPKKRTTTAAAASNSAAAAARSTAVDPGQKSGGNNNSNSLASLQKASANDANSMLAQMSPDERRNNAQELQSSLSPDTLAFLKRRAQSKHNSSSIANQQQQPTEVSTGSTSNQSNNDATTSATTLPAAIVGSPEEKQRVAALLSNIKNQKDLDAAYQAEMGTYSPLQSSEISSDMLEQAEDDTFPLACTLLRSTVPRQNLWAAQVVSKRLQEQWENGSLCSVVTGNANTTSNSKSPQQKQTPPQTPIWPYTKMLPASLRCLLDAPVSQTNGYVLHTYVLQALYNLIRLRACAEHVVDVDIKAKTRANYVQSTAAIYQEYFLEDAVPTPPVGSCYESIANLEAVDATNNPTAPSSSAVAYKTGSSSTSAQRDGEAFAKDPMWTLLTRMCMIPRLAHLLKLAAQHQARGETVIPKEAIVAICGILAMIGQRAPGAATAIAHHETLMKNLLAVTVMPHENFGAEENSNQPYDPIVAVPAMQLLCALARQSRTSAGNIPVDDIVPPLLAMKAQDASQLELQRWSVILWRTLLRYGFGLPQIPIMVTIATPHMALGNPGMDPYSLTTEFSSSFSNLLQCVQISRRCIAAKNESGNQEDVITQQQYDALSQADLWLSSSAQQVMTQLENKPSESSTGEVSLAEILRFRSGQLQFLSAFLRTSNEDVRLSAGVRGKSKTADSAVSNTWLRSSQQVLRAIVEDGLLKQALDLVSPSIFAVDFYNLPGGNEMTLEASACSFLCAIGTLQHFLLIESRNQNNKSPEVQDSESQESVAFVVGQFALIVRDSFRNNAKHDKTTEDCGGLTTTARRGWLNRAGFAIVELLTAATDSGVLSEEEGGGNVGLLRKLQFALLGRLERGDEAMAVILFSQDSSFKTPDPIDSVQDSSVLSSMFFREMCRTGAARSRLDHSFKLKHGPGISHDEFGCFKLVSLLSDADLPGQSGDGPDFALPVGKLWLWQVLSSSIAPESKENVIHEEKEPEQEVVEILSSSLRLILELEQADVADDMYTYTSHIPTGAKTYHLLMLCLQPESILQNDRITSPAELLLDEYIGKDQQTLFGVDLARACMVHSGAKKKASTVSAKVEAEEAKVEKLMSQIMAEPNADTAGKFEESEVRALVQLSGELCEAYIEYGAPYDLFTKCIRIFLLPSFPAKVRSQTMRRVGDILHLISLPGEDDPSSEDCKERLLVLLEASIAGLGSSRDPPEFLDSVASVYAKGASSRLVFGYVYLLSALVQSRHLAICFQPGQVGLEAAKRRLQTVNAEFASVVIDATERFLTGADKSKMNLARATIDAALQWEKVKVAPPQATTVSASFDRLKALAKT